MKKNIFLLVIAILSVFSMSSCCSLGGFGSGYGYGYGRGYSGPSETGVIGSVIQNKTGCWSNDGVRITVTKQTATKGLYYVDNRGECDFYYLQPVANAAKSLPYGVEVISYRPYWNTFYGELVWMFYTTGKCRKIMVGNKGKYVVVE